MKWFVLASRTGMVKIFSGGFQGESRCFEVDCTHASWHRLAEDIVTSVICWKGWAFQSQLIEQLWSDFLTPCWSTTFLRMCFIPRIFTDHLSRNFVPWLDLESNFGENQHDYCAEHHHTLFVQYCLQHPPQVMTTHLLHVPVLPLNLLSYTVMSSGVKVHARFLLEGCTAGFHARRLFVARRRERKDKTVARMTGEFLALKSPFEFPLQNGRTCATYKPFFGRVSVGLKMPGYCQFVVVFDSLNAGAMQKSFCRNF